MPEDKEVSVLGESGAVSVENLPWSLTGPCKATTSNSKCTFTGPCQVTLSTPPCTLTGPCQATHPIPHVLGLSGLVAGLLDKLLGYPGFVKQEKSFLVSSTTSLVSCLNLPFNTTDILVSYVATGMLA